MKETTEHNNRFYGEELKTESEQLKEWLIVANKEIERLNNIIKEVREYIEHNSYESGDTSSMYLIDVDKLLEILDKEKNNEQRR